MRHARSTLARLILATLAIGSTARADVYLGTAFNIRDLVDRPEAWTDVRAHATGYYFHPRSGNEASELKGLEQRRVTDLFASRVAITERNNGGAPEGDTKQYELMRDCGMTPVAGLVAEVNALGPWRARVEASTYTATSGEVVRVPLVADQRPWTSAWNRTPDWTLDEVDRRATTLPVDDELPMRLAIMTGGAGFALETDNGRSFVDGKMDPTSKHFRICRQMLRYAQSKGKMTMLFLHGFEEAGDPARYVENNLAFLRAVEDARAYPDVLICSFYSSGSPVKLLPETTERDGRRVPAETLTGLTWAALAREGAIPLRDDERPRVTTAPDEAGTLTVRVENPNPTLDFAPAIVVEGGAGVTFAFDGDAFAPLGAGGSIAFIGAHRLMPGAMKVVRVRSASGVAKVSYRDHAFARSSPTREVATIAGR